MENCVFKTTGGNCRCLVTAKCSSCPFKKTEKQLKEGRRNALARLISLSDGDDLLKKYYGMSREQAIVHYWDLAK